MQRLSPLDASFLHIEDTGPLMHIGAIAVVEGPALSRETLARLVESKLPVIPRYRETVRTPALALGRPVWVEDPTFDITYHVRHTALPSPGGDDELRALMARVMSQRLDRTRPLWEMWMVEGLEDDRWALIVKVHHAMVDGVSGVDLLAVLLDYDPGVAPTEPAAWSPERQPSSPELALRALGHRAVSPIGPLRAATRGLIAPRDTAVKTLATMQGLGALARVLRTTATTSLNGPVGGECRLDWARGSLAEIKTIRSALGGTVNDVVLAAIAAGMRALLLGRGEDCTRPVRTMVPVSLRGAGEHNRFDNRVSAIFAELPVDASDPLERLTRVRADIGHLKEAHEVLGTELVLGIYHLIPAALQGPWVHAAARREQHLVATVTTNVPGPQQTLYAAGRRVVELLPYVPIAVNVRTGVAILSYDGQIVFGITGDRDDPDDLAVFTAAIERDLVDLAERARARHSEPALG